MSNVFLLYMPPGNAQAMVHYQDTIVNRVPLRRIDAFIPSNLKARLAGLFGSKPIAVWGSESGPRNRANFERMSVGDDALIIEGDRIKFIGKIAAKTENRVLSQELWKPLTGDASTTWELIYFIANPRQLDLEFTKFCKLFGYAPGYQLRGFTTVAAAKLEEFYRHYDDLYSILERLQNGQPIAEKEAVAPALSAAVDPLDLAELRAEDIDQVLQADLSQHATIQWKLARLGLKAGERVWVPAGDQSRLRRDFQFEDFDPEFAAGIDLPHSYMENIDVVWKQEFRIGAAYEIENSTSIYSGLLRFADLNILAPNTLYPMFVVAPSDRKNRVRQQLCRPTFKRLGLDRKVRFLSYESIDEIDSFFAMADSGLTVETVVGRSEPVAC